MVEVPVLRQALIEVGAEVEIATPTVVDAAMVVAVAEKVMMEVDTATMALVAIVIVAHLTIGVTTHLTTVAPHREAAGESVETR